MVFHRFPLCPLRRSSCRSGSAGRPGRRLVREPAEQAFFGEQALEESEVAFLVLDGHTALGIKARVGQVPAPVRGALALVAPVAEQFVDDLDDALVLEQIAVAVVAEEGEPGFEDQAIAGETAVGAEAHDVGEVAVKRTQCRARLTGLQIEPGRLAEQCGQGLMGEITGRTVGPAAPGANWTLLTMSTNSLLTASRSCL